MKRFVGILVLLLSLVLVLGAVGCGNGSDKYTGPATEDTSSDESRTAPVVERTTPITEDTSPPAIAGVVSSTSALGVTVSWRTDEAATSQAEWGLSVSYGSTSNLDSTLVTSHCIQLTGLVPGATYHYRVKSKDGAGNESQSLDYTVRFCPSTGPTVTGAAAADIAATSATITWTTDVPSTSRVEYGTTGSPGEMTLDQDLVTSHSVTLTSLRQSTSYYYRVISMDACGNVGTASPDLTFTTTESTNMAIARAMSPVADGDGVAEAAAYQPASPRVHPLVLIADSGEPHSWTDSIPSQWQPQSAEETELVACIGAQEEDDLGECRYTNGRVLHRIQYHRRVTLREAKTGKVVSDTTLRGSDPGCPLHIGPGDDADGTEVELENVTNWLATWVLPTTISDVAVTPESWGGVTVAWSTDEASTSCVVYGETTDYGSQTSTDDSFVTSHEVELSEFFWHVTIHYRVRSIDADGNWYQSGDRTFVYTGDDADQDIPDDYPY